MSVASVADLLRALAAAFAERRLRWYVFGAQAVVAHGRPRLTADVDVTVELASTTPGELTALLEGYAFHLRFPLPSDPADPPRLIPLLHAPSSMPVDLVVAAPGLDEEFLERARAIDLGGALVPVISAEDLVAMKILAGRRKDLEDVRGVLLEKRGELDLDRVRDVLRAFEEVTGEAKLLPRLERLLRAARPRQKRR